MVNFKLNNIFFQHSEKKQNKLLSMGFIKPWKNDTTNCSDKVWVGSHNKIR